MSEPQEERLPPVSKPQPTFSSDWFKRFPTGGTSYELPPTPRDVTEVEFYRRMPNGGGTIYRKSGGENGDK